MERGSREAALPLEAACQTRELSGGTNGQGTHCHVLPDPARIISNILILSQPGHRCPLICSPPSSHPFLWKITLNCRTQSRAPLPGTWGEEASPLAISWWQQAACHVPATHSPMAPWPTAPCPHSPSPGLRCAAGCLAPTAPICTSRRFGPTCSSHRSQWCGWVYTSGTGAQIWPHTCRLSLQTHSCSRLSDTPEIPPPLKGGGQEMETMGAMMCGQRFHVLSLVTHFMSPALQTPSTPVWGAHPQQTQNCCRCHRLGTLTSARRGTGRAMRAAP